MTVRVALVASLVACAIGCRSSHRDAGPESELVFAAVEIVDDDSPYMRALADHVTSDPAAAAGIEADVERWTTADGVAHAAPFLRASEHGDKLGRPTLVDYLAASAHAAAFALPADRTVGYARVDGAKGTWRTYVVQPDPAIAAAIAKVEPATDASSAPAAAVELTTPGSPTIAELAPRIAGRRLAILVDGELTARHVVAAHVTAGKLLLSPIGPSASADDLVAVLRLATLPCRLRAVPST